MSDTIPTKPILGVDFDGVLHRYDSGWKGAGTIPDAPVKGAMEFLREAARVFRVAIYSSRSHEPEGIPAMQAWVFEHLCTELGADTGTWVFEQLEWPETKPPAKVSLDDRVVAFEGEFPSITSLLDFQPWNRR